MDWNPRLSNLDAADIGAVEAFIERFQAQITRYNYFLA